jgi:hypothetical protein
MADNDNGIPIEAWRRTAESLLAKGLIRIAGRRADGTPAYELTERGARLTDKTMRNSPNWTPN